MSFSTVKYFFQKQNKQTKRKIVQMVVYPLEVPLLSHGVKGPGPWDMANSDIS